MIFFRKLEEPGAEPEAGDVAKLRARAEAAALPEAAQRAVEHELARLDKTDPAVAEYSIAFNYVEYVLSLPWNALTPDQLDQARAQAVLESSHAGLAQVKDRILEYLAARSMRSLAKPAVLVVDDEAIARDNLAHVMAKDGYQVQTAANGVEALDKVRRFEFDLIITDLKMERMDGLQLLQEAKAASPSTEIMLVTGFATVDTAVKALKTGAVHYLSKPIEIGELRAAVREILSSRTSRLGFTAPILCFVGPPGVGKTSVGRAVAEALGRRFHRISLADLRDESELRGHRRTYVGALPGRILQGIRAAGVRNPVFMLDEMDKIGHDVKGDPAAALLEVLDPEQNSRFLDRYLDVPFDLSGVLFIATANSLDRLAGPLLDRLEVAPFSGYSEAEKMEIATRFLIPRQLREHGLTHPYPSVTGPALAAIIRDHTNEAGVRNLEREIARVCRKLARICLEENRTSHEGEIGPELVASLLGPRRFTHEAAERAPRVGVAAGLVWSDAGGEIVFVEATRMAGSSQLLLTGSLGGVLKESAQIALSHLRSNADRFGIAPDFFAGHDLHVHIPAGGVSKDGPSAGLTIAAALASLLTGRPVRPDVALSGEISLSGRVLPVAGVREKILAALRGGVKTVVLPAANAADVEAVRRTVPDIPDIVLAEDAAQGLAAALA
ncbi:MAG: S16 family serine protease [Thermodesulfobacteriota bacterium]